MTRTLYTTPYCPYCDFVKEELERRGLPYDEVVVPAPRSQREEVLRLSGQTQVPVLVDGEQVVHDSRRIVEHLKRTYR